MNWKLDIPIFAFEEVENVATLQDHVKAKFSTLWSLKGMAVNYYNIVYDAIILINILRCGRTADF